ncbi:MAG TPA: PTS fructose transporter subunit IIC [Phycisphaerae bacterium]|nr:PTS fructose transporter subunit IIC [Phycisphaerae bacterium]HNU44047.1 PTS fructose transporter subunit IIC [Phycisphaerae bacterium]
MIESLKTLRQYLLTGVSYVIPCIACGGILIATAIAFAPMTAAGPDFSTSPVLSLVLQLGVAAFKLALPILAGFIAHAIAGKPGLVPGLIGGYLAAGFDARLLFDAAQLEARGLKPDSQIMAGFLGAIVIGLLAGWIVSLIKKVPVPRYIKPIMPILIIPIVASGLVGVLMFKVLGVPIADLMAGLGAWLKTMSTGNAVVLAMILGAMIAFDMGGPVNKAAFFFGAAMIQEQNYAVMGACAAAICTPPLGLGLATILGRKLWGPEDKEAGIAALAMGMIGITEGAIPFAAADPLRVIPCIMFGSMVAAVAAMLGGVGDHAPHGGPIVLPVVDNRLAYVIAIIVGTVVTAVVVNACKKWTGKRNPQTAEGAA